MPQRVLQCWMCVYISEFPFLITFVFPCRSLTCVQLLDQRQPSSLRCSILIWTCHFQVSSAVTLRKFDWIFNLYTYYYAQRSITRLTDYFRLTASVLPKLWYIFFLAPRGLCHCQRCGQQALLPTCAPGQASQQPMHHGGQP